MDPIAARHEIEGTAPAAALRLWFEALFLYLQPATRDVGRAELAYLTIPFKKDPQWDRRPSNLTFASRLRDPRRHHIFHSYVRGTSPQNGYRFAPQGWELEVVRDEPDAHGRGHVVALRSSGADSLRPIYLKKSTRNGLYFVDKHSNVYVGVRPPQDPEAEDFV